ncbi:hypothetical protein K450DRAFT_247233 [Umbelopsis ramanniana AG]|uniref:Uncharacterized protein n=1 Tax=Umbelopsis ramanniana AG TaxID=1314678 RepID=A0AAD5HBN0_UMBRA|nr:uncharacterized protein K450DRAFT_247233 [Umbelopsis ramanniana AG]KAI8578310.1 hypothetical protein K450DRAFT_247233 [Umbelopsis ramanniana AG]
MREPLSTFRSLSMLGVEDRGIHVQCKLLLAASLLIRMSAKYTVNRCRKMAIALLSGKNFGVVV